MEPHSHLDVWASGEAYEPYVGRWSRAVAREFVPWLAIPAGGRWLDVGCGTGALTETILQLAAPTAVTGVDPAERYVAFARRHIVDERVRFLVGAAGTLARETESYDAAVAGLVLNFMPDPGRAIREMARMTRLGGIVAAYVWDYAGGMQLMRHFWDAAATLDPAAQDLDEGRRFPLCRPEPLVQLFDAAALRAVTVRAIDVPTPFRDFDDYWTPFLGGQGPAPAYAMALDEARRAALREQMRARLPVDPDGSIHLSARAWAVRGTRLDAHTHAD